MLVDSDVIRHVQQSGQWKHIMVITVVLMGLYVLFSSSGDNLPSVPTSTTAKATGTSLAPPGPSSTSTRLDGLPSFVTPHKVVVEEKVYVNETEIEVPYDSIPPDEYVAICLSVKDQSQDLNEFLTHHYYHHQIRRFYVMDDGSDPPLSSFEYPGIPRSALSFTYQHRLMRIAHMQMLFYSACIERYGLRHRWMAFIDADEYIETPGPESFQEILESFDSNNSVGALGINWKVHTSSGIKTRPADTRHHFDTCAFDGKGTVNNIIKSVVKTSLVIKPLNPQKFLLKDGAETVGENGDIVTTVAYREPITRARVGLHHYAIKSLEEFEEKLHRGNGMSDPQSRNFWEKVEYNMEKVNCTEIMEYFP